MSRSLPSRKGRDAAVNGQARFGFCRVFGFGKSPEGPSCEDSHQMLLGSAAFKGQPKGPQLSYERFLVLYPHCKQDTLFFDQPAFWAHNPNQTFHEQ